MTSMSLPSRGDRFEPLCLSVIRHCSLCQRGSPRVSFETTIFSSQSWYRLYRVVSCSFSSSSKSLIRENGFFPNSPLVTNSYARRLPGMLPPGFLRRLFSQAMPVMYHDSYWLRLIMYHVSLQGKFHDRSLLQFCCLLLKLPYLTSSP